MTAIESTIKNLNRDAEAIRNTDPQNVATMEVGDEWRQGDVRIKRVPDDFVAKNGRRLRAAKVAQQLAPGATQGSRHLLASIKGVKMYTLADATEIDGPIVVLEAPNSVTHPEHGDVVNMPVGCYAFPGQRAFADELRRAAD